MYPTFTIHFQLNSDSTASYSIQLNLTISSDDMTLPYDNKENASDLISFPNAIKLKKMIFFFYILTLWHKI